MLAIALPHPEQIKIAIIQIIEDFSDDALNGRIPKMMFTEENLLTIQDTFGLTVNCLYESGIIKKIEYLLSYVYDVVRKEEIKERNQEKENAGELKSESGTQFPEHYEVSSYIKNII